MQYVFLFFIFVSSLTVSDFAQAITELPKTGQDNSETRADDGELQLGTVWPSPRFTDNRDGTLSDNLTGLMWIKDAFCANNFISGASTSNWEDVIAYTEALNENTLATPCNEYTARYQDWRAPNINELASLIRAGLTNNTSISEWLYVPDDQSGAFSEIGIVNNPIWSSTTVAGNTNQIWQINLKTGEFTQSEKFSSSQLAFIFSAVRSNDQPFYLATGQSISYTNRDDGDLQQGIKPPAIRFIATELGTVIDKLTGLMWLQNANCANPTGSNWINASNSIHQNLITTPFFDNCPDYTPSIIDDFPEKWRLPNINELRSLINYGESNPALDSNHPFTIITDKPFWSSTSANNTPTTAAWTLSLESGAISPVTDKSTLAYTWPVRGPVEFADIQSDVEMLSYNSLFVNAEQVSQSIQLTNTGKAALEIEVLKLTDDAGNTLEQHFSLGRDSCSERHLDTEESCSVIINFSPQRAGILLARLTINSSALGIPEFSIPISGTGLAATSTEKSNPSCFIATAAYGSFLEPEVEILRNFRDEVLLQHDWGKNLVKKYYEVSPPYANYLSSHESLRTTARTLLTPVVYAVKYPGTALILLLFLLACTFHRTVNLTNLLRIPKLITGENYRQP